MIKAFDIERKLYLEFNDYVASLSDAVSMFGRERAISEISEHAASGGVLITSASHKLVSGQIIHITDTTDYDGRYSAIVIDKNSFYCPDLLYVSDESSGIFRPVMDGKYYFAFMYGVEQIFDKVKNLSAVKAAGLHTEQGASMIDNFSFTDDRRDTFISLLNEACDKVYAKLSGYSSKILIPYTFNEQIDMDADGVISERESNYMIRFMINLKHVPVNSSLLALADTNLFNSIVFDVLANWSMLSSNTNDFPVYDFRSRDMLLGAMQMIGRSMMKPGVKLNNFL